MLRRALPLLLALGCAPLGSDEDPGDASPRAPDAGADLDAEGPRPDLDPEAPDAGPRPDAAAPLEPDASLELPCGQLAADAPRVVLLGHPFSGEVGVDGTEVRSLTLPPDGLPLDDGVRLDVGTRPQALVAAPSGAFAVVLGEDGVLSSISTESAGTIAVVDTISLDGAGWSDLQMHPDGALLTAARHDVGAESGLYTVHLTCEGRLEPAVGHYSLRLAAALALSPVDPTRGLLLGGQAVFEPEDPNDLRLVELVDDRWEERGAFNVYGDFVDATGIALSGDGRTALVPNGSPFSDDGQQIAVVRVEGDALREVDRLTDQGDVRRARFAPDGTTALVTDLEGGRVLVLRPKGESYEVVERIGGIGLPDDLGVVHRGPGRGTVLVPSTHPGSGPTLTVLRVEGGAVQRVGDVLLGEGSENIPGPVSVAR